MRRSKPLPLDLFRKLEGPEILAALGFLRQKLIQPQFPLGSPDYILSREILARIDDMAELLTGDREHFWARAPSVDSRPPH